MKEKKINVFFDGSCKVCTKEVSFYNKHDKKISLIGLILIVKIKIYKN